MRCIFRCAALFSQKTIWCPFFAVIGRNPLFSAVLPYFPPSRARRCKIFAKVLTKILNCVILKVIINTDISAEQPLLFTRRKSMNFIAALSLPKNADSKVAKSASEFRANCCRITYFGAVLASPLLNRRFLICPMSTNGGSSIR